MNLAIKHLIKPRAGGLPLSDVDLRKATDAELMELSKEMGIGLDLNEMKTVRDHYIELGRNPTDVEVQAFGQAWSEHCCYKSSKPILKQHVFNIKNPKVILKGDAGIVD